MSTELFEAKGLADEIHHAARVSEKHNPEIYMMTIGHIESLIKAMDDAGLTMADQRKRMGAKKDELIGELKRLRDQGVLRTGDEGQPRAAPMVMPMTKINVQRPH